MRLRISHETRYRYEAPAKRIVQTVRLTPRNHDGQYVARWRVEVAADCRLDRQEDAFGNVTHTFTLEGDIGEIAMLVAGEVETEDRNGIIRGTVERFPPSLFLRETELTAVDGALKALASDIAAAAGTEPLDRLHGLLAHLSDNLDFDPTIGTPVASAAETFAAGRGRARDIAHVFVACARHLGSPARHVTGYIHRIEGARHQAASHAWAEAHVEGLGWVGFDPVNGLCTTDAHVRVAVGLDHLGTAAVRGAHTGGEGETLDVAVRIDQAMAQSQT